MKKSFILFAVFIVLALVSLASADELSFRHIDAYVGGEKFSNLEKDTHDLEVRPGEELRLVIEIRNLFDERDRIEIDGIEMTVTVHDIRGNGDDLYYEFRNFGLDAGEDKDKEVVFDIPEDALTGDYILEIKAEGRDDNKKNQEESFVFPLRLRKRPHDILLGQPTFDPRGVNCGETAMLSVEADNKGQVVENVKITVTNIELDIQKKYETVLKVGSIGQNSKIVKEFPIEFPLGIGTGVYSFDVVAEYFGKRITKKAQIMVDCEDLPTEPGKRYLLKKETINLAGGSVADTEKTFISSFFSSKGKDIALFSGLGIIILVLVFLVFGMLLRR